MALVVCRKVSSTFTSKCLLCEGTRRWFLMTHLVKDTLFRIYVFKSQPFAMFVVSRERMKICPQQKSTSPWLWAVTQVIKSLLYNVGMISWFRLSSKCDCDVLLLYLSLTKTNDAINNRRSHSRSGRTKISFHLMARTSLCKVNHSGVLSLYKDNINEKLFNNTPLARSSH